MNIIEQIDDKFRAKAGNEIHPNDVVPLQRYEWQQIKEAFAKVREDALEALRKDAERNAQIATRVINHLKFLNEAIKRCENQFRDEKFGVEWHDAADDCKSDYEFTAQLVDEMDASLNIKGGAE
jgi:hypothetical protein